MANELVFDGNVTFIGGQDASKSPDLISESCYASGVNTTTQNGVLGPRWGLHQKPLTIEDGTITLPTLQTRTYEEVFYSGKYQAVAPYTIGAENYIVYVISGIIFAVNIDTYFVRRIEVADGSYLNELAPRINWESANQYLIFHDYPAYPIIVEGFSAKRADPALFEVPISVLGAYNQNRVFIVNAGNEFTGGDPTGNTATPDAPITFTEVEQTGSPFFGQIFQLPTDHANDPVTAMTFLQSVDTSTGIGPLLVSTRNAIYSYNTQNPRTQWEQGQFGSTLLYSVGIAGQRASANVNGDLFFLSTDGQVRSLSMSRTEQSKWTKVPMSREVKNWLKYWDKSLIPYANVSYFENKIFITCNPYRVNALNQSGAPITDVTHGGFVVLELDNISTLSGETSAPTWAGLWTGVRPMDTVIINNRMFVVSKDAAYRNELYEFDPATTYDTVEGKERLINSTVYTRTYSFKTEFQEKTIHSIDLSLQEIQGCFDLKVSYKPSHGSEFVNWRSFNHFAPYKTCQVPTPQQLRGFTKHNFKVVNLGSPQSDACDPVTRSYYSWFRKVQLKLEMLGRDWNVEAFRIKAISQAQSENDIDCTGEFPVVETYGECSNDWAIPGRKV